MQVRPGEHGSTYGGNPLACKVATAALEVLVEEKLAENAEAMGARLREGLASLIEQEGGGGGGGVGVVGQQQQQQQQGAAVEVGGGGGGGGGGVLRGVRGKGLLTALLVNDSEEGSLASEMCTRLMRRGLLAKPTHGNVIRLAPPLCISAAQVDEALGIIEGVVKETAK